MKAKISYKIECELEADGRWIAEISDIPGAMAYGETRDNAIAKVQALALRIAADKIEARELSPALAPLTAAFA